MKASWSDYRCWWPGETSSLRVGPRPSLPVTTSASQCSKCPQHQLHGDDACSGPGPARGRRATKTRDLTLAGRDLNAAQGPRSHGASCAITTSAGPSAMIWSTSASVSASSRNDDTPSVCP